MLEKLEKNERDMSKARAVDELQISRVMLSKVDHPAAVEGIVMLDMAGKSVASDPNKLSLIKTSCA